MNISTENGAQLTLEQLMPEIFQRQTVGVSVHHARTSHLPENEKDLTETEVVSLEKFLGSSTNSKKKINPNGLSMRMLRECLAATEDLIISQYSVNWIGGGYDTEWQVFNSKDYGVPQNRERVYTIGHFRKRGVKKIFPVAATNGENPIRIAQIGYDGSRERRNPDTFRVYDVGGVSPTLTTMERGNCEPHIPIIL